jgi:hypothetical protein
MERKPDTAEPQKPRGRWFQFRLRTLPIAVVLLSIPCGYVAQEANIVLTRKAWLADFHCLAAIEADPSRGIYPEHPVKSPSVVRRLLGDKPYSSIGVCLGRDLPEARQLFPAAGVGVPELTIPPLALPAINATLSHHPPAHIVDSGAAGLEDAQHRLGRMPYAE